MSFGMHIHGCQIAAHSSATKGAPLTIDLVGDRAQTPHSIVIFTEDQQLTDRLVEVINAAVADRRAELAAAAVAKEMCDEH